MAVRSGSLQSTLAGVLLLSATATQAQPAAAPANHPPPTTAQSIARAAADANQAEAIASAPYGQPPQPAVPDPATKPRQSSFDPAAIHYPYGRPSLGNIDPSSAANPYGPYARDPITAGPALLPPLRAGRRAR